MRLLCAAFVMLIATAAVRGDAKEDAAKLDVRNLTLAVKTYKIKRGTFPDELADLKTAGYLDPKATLLDPWGNAYKYDAKGKRNGGKQPDIWAVTPDQKEIGNWMAEQKK
jgi:hypothetical protein